MSIDIATLSPAYGSGGRGFESFPARQFGTKCANVGSRRVYARGGNKGPQQFGFRAEDANLARTDDLDALRDSPKWSANPALMKTARIRRRPPSRGM
jgi:hypothetical protein